MKNTLTFDERMLFKHAYNILESIDFLGFYDPYFDDKMQDLLHYIECRYFPSGTKRSQ